MNPLTRGRLERLYFNLTGVDPAGLSDAELIRRIKLAQELARVLKFS